METNLVGKYVVQNGQYLEIRVVYFHDGEVKLLVENPDGLLFGCYAAGCVVRISDTPKGIKDESA